MREYFLRGTTLALAVLLGILGIAVLHHAQCTKYLASRGVNRHRDSTDYVNHRNRNTPPMFCGDGK